MRVEIDVRQFARDVQDLERLIDSAEPGITRALRVGAMNIQGDMVRAVQSSPATGRMRPSGDPASSPGNAPRTDTGRLVSSLRVEPAIGGADLLIPVGYASALEYGTRNMAPRPFVGPAIERQTPRITQDVADAVGRAR